MDVDAVVSAAHWAAVLAWICAAGFMGWYAWGLRSVAWCRRGRRGRPDSFTWHLVVVHADAEPSHPDGSRAALFFALDRLAAAFPQATLWAVPGPTAGDQAAADVRSVCAQDPRWHQLGAAIPHSDAADAAAETAAAADDADDDTDLVARIRRQLGSRHVADPDQVLIGLLDSTSELDADALVFLAGRDMFADPNVGAVQTAHRGAAGAGSTRRATPGAEVFRRIQDIEVRGPLAAAQLANRRRGTCILGGPGRFLRLSALAESVDDAAPASSLATRLHETGWATAYSMDAIVTVRTEDELRAHVDRRRDWARATMARAPELLRLSRSAAGTRAQRLAGARPLLHPWCYLLGTVLVAVLGLCLMGFTLLNWEPAVTFALHGGLLALLALATIAYGEFALWGLAYGLRFEPAYGPIRGVTTGLAHALLGIAYVASVWLALADLVRGAGFGWLPRRAHATNTDDQPSAVRPLAVVPEFTMAPASLPEPATRPTAVAAPASLDEEYWQTAVLAQAAASRAEVSMGHARQRVSAAPRRRTATPRVAGRSEPEHTGAQRRVSEAAGRHRA